ncbi:MAG: hypothetical protein AAF789_07180, partial [Bacteroidota bacterium]
MNKYALLFRQHPDVEAGWSQDIRENSIKNWSDWIQKLMKQEVFDGGHRFTAKGYTIDQKKDAREGQYLCKKVSVIGYSLVKAKSLEAA